MIRIGDRVAIRHKPHAGEWKVYGRHPRPGVVWLTPADDNARRLARHTKYGMLGVSSKDLDPLTNTGDTLL